jgi:hypothetical protein
MSDDGWDVRWIMIDDSFIQDLYHPRPLLLTMRDMLKKRSRVKIFGFLIFCFLLCALSNAFSSVSSNDATLVENQLGYLPTNFISVSAWSDRGEKPVAIKTYPLFGGAKRRQEKSKVQGQTINAPFPTLYWLTCPDISSAVADLERQGYIKNYEAAVNENSDLVDRLMRCHEECAKERWQSLTDEDRALLSQDNQSILRMRNMMQFSGISGTNCTSYKGERLFVPPLKCLHAHYAYFRSAMKSESNSISPVGEMIHATLEMEFPDLEL